MPLMPLIGPVMEIIGKFFPDKDKQLEVQQALEQEFTKQMGMQKDIIINDSKSDSWLTRNWRPLSIVIFLSIIVIHFILFTIIPYFKIMFGWNIWLMADKGLNPMFWTTMQIFSGLYGVARTAEKITSIKS